MNDADNEISIESLILSTLNKLAVKVEDVLQIVKKSTIIPRKERKAEMFVIRRKVDGKYYLNPNFRERKILLDVVGEAGYQDAVWTLNLNLCRAFKLISDAYRVISLRHELIHAKGARLEENDYEVLPVEVVVSTVPIAKKEGS